MEIPDSVAARPADATETVFPHVAVGSRVVVGAAAVAGDGFLVRPDQAPALLERLRAALELLDGVAEDARRLADVDPPGGDPVSQQVVRDIALGVTSGDGALARAVAEYRTALEATARDLEAALRQRSQAEAATDARFGDAAR
ncbi:hypothetical protein LX15_004335 [Streptoalloteichus tenebrarius]|uniref:Uncharacterized protein n=1 Tax=Streptoalloteichus tenebrarius (strain ATCC 17920 / DSM 40477 / JCM 4838 / CBS 697.72 / NBRC 16177 / NCIMB 11028 / NRRL B-12390 / A12253. 1 / ISP 5477) TaxID=1933 RepID=A0ABT1HYM0_STRSD|nr:hypothetical protein [Streptoalloteichus tenebrarius]MCP2260616.1 hypothetical protein [Streptoalloteichus tenebrarius]BFF01499.1 hypothetical protein GCM10020241_31740 [Streptoalloteichus tenebrarius]